MGDASGAVALFGATGRHGPPTHSRVRPGRPRRRRVRPDGASGEGVTDVLRALRAQISEDRLRQKIGDEEEAEPWRP